MDKPMLCPMSYNGRLIYYASDSEHEFGLHKPMECTPDCAWAGKRQGRYFCTVPAKISEWTEEINSRLLEGDAE